MRLQVALAHAGFASRRKSAEIILSGKVRVNGRVITEPGYKVDLSKDEVVCGKKKCVAERPVYILINKPEGVISSAKDTHGRKTVFDLLPENPERLHHVGRLDKDTSGLLLLTNDGEISYRLTHPKYEIKRIYEATIEGKLSAEKKDKLERGVFIEGARTSRCRINVLNKSAERTILRIELHEGRKRQIRNMFGVVGHPVMKLKRLKFGSLDLKGLKTGAYRRLSKLEITKLKDEVGLKT